MSEKQVNTCAFKDCTKKIRISYIECKCGKIYCNLHKYPEKHECDYDYKENANKKQRIAELKCVSTKIPNKI
jgi:hypothetical protein